MASTGGIAAGARNGGGKAAAGMAAGDVRGIRVAATFALGD